MYMEEEYTVTLAIVKENMRMKAPSPAVELFSGLDLDPISAGSEAIFCRGFFPHGGNDKLG